MLFLVFTSATGVLANGDDEPELKVRPETLFFRQTGTTPPPPREISVSAEGVDSFPFTVEATTTIGNWLSVTPLEGPGPAMLTVSVNTAGLAVGEYSGEIIVTAPGLDDSPEKVKVELRIGRPGVGALIVRPHELEFKVVEGGPAPVSRRLHIFNTGGEDFAWTAVSSVLTPPGVEWLNVSPASGMGDSVIEVSVDPALLEGQSLDEFEGEIAITSGSRTVRVEVELEFKGVRPARLVIHPRAFNFIVEPNEDLNDNEPLEPKELKIKNAGAGTLNWTATATVETPEGGAWLSIEPDAGAGEGEVAIAADPTGLLPGMYSGEVTVTVGEDSQKARVFLRILGPAEPRVRVRPKALQFSVAEGTVSPESRTLEVKSEAAGLTFTATVETARGGDWLSITPDSGAVPGEITVAVVSGVVLALEPGVYTGNIEITVPGAAKEVHNVHVALKVFGAEDTPRLKLRPGGMAFVAVESGANPEAKEVELEPKGAASIAWDSTVSTVTGGAWLTVLPASDTAPVEAAVSVDITGLAAGVYSGSVVFTPVAASGASPVTLVVKLIVRAEVVIATAGGPPRAAIFPFAPLVPLFTEPEGGFITQADLPLNVGVLLLDAGGALVAGATVVVSSSNTEPDLVLEDLGGGEYAALFRALSSGPLTLTGSAQVLGVQSPSFAVSGDMEASAGIATVIFPAGAVNTASFAASPTPLAPGALMSLFGTGLAGSGGVATTIPLPRSLGGVSVSIGGFSAPLLAAVGGNTDQINLQVPFELDGLSQAEVVVNNNGVLSAPETIALGPAVPALFTLSQTGAGSGAIFHGDFAPVDAANPAAAGEVILLFATGLGAVEPSVSTGDAAAGLTTVSGSVQVNIGGQPATVDFAGMAPGFVGLYQINARVPAGIPAGEATVAISVDGILSTGSATVAVR
ncbi:MAG: hypothetical protein O7A06_17395 [Acidobacteria bacterium]|nr:hypothetical protein [Acidobacteriota bacterium]